MDYENFNIYIQEHLSQIEKGLTSNQTKIENVENQLTKLQSIVEQLQIQFEHLNTMYLNAKEIRNKQESFDMWRTSVLIPAIVSAIVASATIIARIFIH